MTTLFVGQSHVGAIRAAHQARRATGGKFKRTRGIHTLEQGYAPEMEGMDDPATARFGPLLRAELEQDIALYRPRLFSMMGGNAHNALALIRHPRGYDFRLPGEEAQGPPPEDQAEPVPFALVSTTLERHLELDFLRLRMLRDAAGAFVHVESPPPVRSETLIRERADAFFKDNAIDTLGVAPVGLRWRMWRLNARLFRAQVESLGCRFMPVPDEAKDADGFLREELAGDATHGNADYGQIILRAAEDLVARG
ncbi:hypothetical protein [uncultured Sphingomonas sp.]|uniref:hypothetical protein n=1 Tax=uncultured Sphingomonas sp. TaxID=158754 RepID=UPI0025F47AD2|nr:hypothetical protein [uncultured Sphingomonas sp.]